MAKWPTSFIEFGEVVIEVGGGKRGKWSSMLGILALRLYLHTCNPFPRATPMA